MGYTEFNTIEEPIIQWLRDGLGWHYVPANEIKREHVEPFILDQLQASLIRLNDDIQSSSDADRVIHKIRLVSNDLKGNKDFFSWLKNEESMVFTTGQHSTTITLIDRWMLSASIISPYGIG